MTVGGGYMCRADRLSAIRAGPLNCRKHEDTISYQSAVTAPTTSSSGVWLDGKPAEPGRHTRLSHGPIEKKLSGPTVQSVLKLTLKIVD